MRDIGAIIWVAVIVIGVISSIVKSVKKQQQQAAQSPVPGAQPPLVRTTGVPLGLHAQFAADASPLTPPVLARSAPVAAPVPAPVRRPVRNPAPPVLRSQVPPQMPSVPDYVPPATAYAPAPLDNTPPPHAMVLQQRSVRAARLFGSPKAVLRSIIASEVLGKPRALRDEY